MASDDASRLGWAVRLLLLALVVLPLVTQWVVAGANVVESLGLGSLDVAVLDAASPSSATVVRAVGLGVLTLVVLLLVRQKRRSRGQRPSDGAPEQPEGQRGRRDRRDQRVEGSGEVYAPYAYDNQQAARRESERIRDRAEEIAESERDAYERRRK